MNKYETFLMKWNLTIIFLYNLHEKKEFHVLKMKLYLFLLFQAYGRHTTYMQPYLFPK